MDKKEIKLLINENAGRPFYVYGLFLPGSNCFYVGKGQGERILQHENHSHNEAVLAVFRKLKKSKLKPEYEIFEFYTSERLALKNEARLQKKYLPNGVIVNRMIGTHHIYSDDGKDKYKIIKECDALIAEHEIKTSLRPKESEGLKRWGQFYDFLQELILKPQNEEFEQFDLEYKAPRPHRIVKQNEKTGLPRPSELHLYFGGHKEPKREGCIIRMKPKGILIRKFQGGKEYKKFLDGKTLTRKETMLAHCYECMGGYEEGKQDCQGKSCPLYQYYPYKKA